MVPSITVANLADVSEKDVEFAVHQLSPSRLCDSRSTGYITWSEDPKVSSPARCHFSFKGTVVAQ